MTGRPASAVRLAAIVVVAGLVVVVLVACLREAGRPRPAGPVDETTAASRATTTSVQSLDGLDLCGLLKPEDLPVRPGPNGVAEQEVIFDGNGCSSTVQLATIFDLITASVIRRPAPFGDYKPPAGWSGGFVVIGGRRAWVGRSGSDPRQCSAVFGAADGALQVGVLDETRRGVEPCQTVTDLARIVIPRTPPPAEP